jgi:hypothetical protein
MREGVTSESGRSEGRGSDVGGTEAKNFSFSAAVGVLSNNW